MEGFSMPNVEALSDAELLELSKVLRNLHTYTKVQALARVYRMKGDIGAALGREKWCTLLYNDLPEWAKW